MKVALVIGGSGMLAGLVKRLVSDYEIVGVVGRDGSRLEELMSFSPKIVPIQSDYSNNTTFEEDLKKFVSSYGKPELVVSWIHSTSPKVPLLVADFCVKDFYDVTGESGKNPDHESRDREGVISSKGIKYHRVILGHQNSRWLTNQEISEGVLEAVKSGKPEFVVGQID